MGTKVKLPRNKIPKASVTRSQYVKLYPPKEPMQECSNCYWENVKDSDGDYPAHCNGCTDQNDSWRAVGSLPPPLSKAETDFMANSRLEYLEMENIDLRLQVEKLTYNLKLQQRQVGDNYRELLILIKESEYNNKED